LRLGRAARKQLAELIAGATSLRGDFFRSVAFRHFHPDDVISGEGTRLQGGRFVPVGVRAVYASLEEETALREVTTRKSALGGRSQISVGEYPRMTYVLSVATNRNLDLAVTLPSELANVVRLCLLGPGYLCLAGIGCHLDFGGYRQCRLSVRDGRRPKRCCVSGKRRRW
jgi:hypothetical protein